MNDLAFLWRNREKPSDFRRWCIVWLKRVFHSHRLLYAFWRLSSFRRKGARIGSVASLGRAIIEGRIANLSIGPYSSLGCCTIALHDRVAIGRSVVVNDGVQILTGSHDLEDPSWALTTGAVSVGDFAWIAVNAVICPGVKIGVGAVIGAGAVVRQSVPDYGIVIGNPGFLLSKSRTEDLNYMPSLLNAPIEAWIGRNRIALQSGVRQ